MKRLIALAILAFSVRLSLAPSAYGDEALYITAGRRLLREGGMFYRLSGTYVWPVLAATLELHGARIIAALCGAAMVVLTALYTNDRRLALIAAAPMCLCAAPVAVGRMATHDALSIALAMGGVVLWQRRLPIAAASVLFAGFLVKYSVALFFPMLCILWPHPLFVLPLTAASAAFFFAQNAEMTHAIAVPLTHLPMKSDWFLHVVLLRAETWLVLLFAAFGRADRRTKWLASFGAVTVLGFEMWSRQDTSFWKYAPYMLFFAAPLYAEAWSRLFRGLALPTAFAASALGLLQVGDIFLPYPDVAPVAEELRQRLVDARTIAADDGALRHTLDPDDRRLVTPYQVGIERLEQGSFDAIVQNGGSSPFEASMTVDRERYDVDWYTPLPHGRELRLYRPRRAHTALALPAMYPLHEKSALSLQNGVLCGTGGAGADWNGPISKIAVRIHSVPAARVTVSVDGLATEVSIPGGRAEQVVVAPPTTGPYRRIAVEITGKRWCIESVYVTAEPAP